MNGPVPSISLHTQLMTYDVHGSDGSAVGFNYDPGKTINISPIDDAGGLTQDSGDYIFQELKTRGRLESGILGIFRVRDNRNDFENDPILPLSEVGNGGSRS